MFLLKEKPVESKHYSMDSRDYVMVHLHLIRKLKKVIGVSYLRALALPVPPTWNILPFTSV